MSGGVDSSVTAALLIERGFDVTGVYMKNWSKDLPGFACPWKEDFQDAKRVAVQLGIDFKMYDFETEYRATGNFSSCLDRLKNRLVDPVADRIIETLRMSREVGGQELPTVLRNLAAYLRDDAAVRAEIEARQSWTVNAARLGVAAPWIVLVLLATRPEAAAAYNTAAGTLVIVAGAALSVIAYWLMLVVGRLPEERRWFQ